MEPTKGTIIQIGNRVVEVIYVVGGSAILSEDVNTHEQVIFGVSDEWFIIPSFEELEDNPKGDE